MRPQPHFVLARRGDDAAHAARGANDSKFSRTQWRVRAANSAHGFSLRLIPSERSVRGGFPPTAALTSGHRRCGVVQYFLAFPAIRTSYPPTPRDPVAPLVTLLRFTFNRKTCLPAQAPETPLTIAADASTRPSAPRSWTAVSTAESIAPWRAVHSPRAALSSHIPRRFPRNNREFRRRAWRSDHAHAQALPLHFRCKPDAP